MKHLFITFTLVSSLFVSAQEAPDPIRAEYFTCSFNAGKDMDDMMKWVEKWNRWMDATDETNYTAAMLFPRYRTCLLYTSPSPRDEKVSRMPSSA